MYQQFLQARVGVQLLLSARLSFLQRRDLLRHLCEFRLLPGSLVGGLLRRSHQICRHGHCDKDGGGGNDEMKISSDESACVSMLRRAVVSVSITTYRRAPLFPLVGRGCTLCCKWGKGLP